jgi:hypothetical protein
VFCPTPLEMLDCSLGSYCPTGTIQPIACGWFSHCPARSATPSDEFVRQFRRSAKGKDISLDFTIDNLYYVNIILNAIVAAEQ